jgi:hypothetical protein
MQQSHSALGALPSDAICMRLGGLVVVARGRECSASGCASVLSALAGRQCGLCSSLGRTATRIQTAPLAITRSLGRASPCPSSLPSSGASQLRSAPFRAAAAAAALPALCSSAAAEPNGECEA